MKVVLNFPAGIGDASRRAACASRGCLQGEGLQAEGERKSWGRRLGQQLAGPCGLLTGYMKTRLFRGSSTAVISRAKGWRFRKSCESGDKMVVELGMSSGRGEAPL